jgi:hypothetical protein
MWKNRGSASRTVHGTRQWRLLFRPTLVHSEMFLEVEEASFTELTVFGMLLACRWVGYASSTIAFVFVRVLVARWTLECGLC